MTSTVPYAIQAEGLDKNFGRFHALSGLDLRVRRGEVHGFLGPNGAGKSTAIRILLGMMRRSGGRAEIFGRDVWRDRVGLHRHLAYVPGDVALWPSMTGGQCIDLLLRMRGLHGRGAAPHRDEAIERFDLDPTKKAKTYSKGNRQKVALVAAFAAPVDLLVLDEPTSGLDPLMEAVFQDHVAEATARGSTVLLSSHILSEVERLCQAVTIIRSGTTVETGLLTDLRRRTSSAVIAEVERPGADLGRIPGVTDVEWRERTVRLAVSPEGLQPLVDCLSRAGVTSLRVEEASLENLFMRHYETAEGKAE